MPTTTPKATIRHVEAHEYALADLQRQLAERRTMILKDLEESEAITKALKAQLQQIDGMVQIAPRMQS